MIRRDLRSHEHNRKSVIHLGNVREVDGAAQLSQGDTVVLATVAGPGQPRYSRHENPDKCTVEVDVNMACQSSLTESMVADFITRALSSCIKLEAFPRMLITFKVLVVRNDGAVLSTALNACTLALLDAGIPMRCFAPCVELCFVGNSTVLLDPTAQEEQQGESNIVVAIAHEGEDAKVLALEVQGCVASDALTVALDNAQKYCVELGNNFRQAIANKILARPRN